MLRLLFLVPIIELLLLVVLAEVTSGKFVLIWLVCAAVLGIILLRTRGVQSLRRMRQGGVFSLAQAPGESLSKTAIHVIAGILLIVPGVLTDLVALAMLFPPTRRWLQLFMLWRFQRRMGSRFAAMAGMASQLGRGMGDGRGLNGDPRDQVIDVKVINPEGRTSERR
jgi:UPF0716 protein FxsA